MHGIMFVAILCSLALRHPRLVTEMLWHFLANAAPGFNFNQQHHNFHVPKLVTAISGHVWGHVCGHFVLTLPTPTTTDNCNF